MTTAHQGTRMTLSEYLALETDGLWELADGELYEMPPPSMDHQGLIGYLYFVLRMYLDGTVPRLGSAWLGVGVALSDTMMLIPDLVFVSSQREGIIRPNYVDGVPDLVVEVLSTNRRHDLALKRGWYAAAGIAEYWILDPTNDTLTILELSGSEYVERSVLNRDDTLATPTIPGFEFSLSKLFDDPDRELIRADE